MQTTPLPKFQLFLTLLIQLAEPITGTVIYPFITRAVRNTGITYGDERKTGYYAGVIESVFFISESLSVYYWGRASDFYGRRPILLIGPLGLSLAMLSFGLSQSFWGMVISRAAMVYSMATSVCVSKTVMAEFTDETNRADAFTLGPLAWTIGATMGPTLGGILADPATRWPDVFGKVAFFKEYPWFLSCSAAGLIAFIAFVLSFWGLKEATPSARSLLGDSKLRITLISMAFLAFTDMTYEVLIPLIYSTSIPTGGLGLSPYQVGLTLGIFMFANGIWNWAVLTPILKKLGPRKTLIVSYSFFLVHFALLWILRDVAARAGMVTPLVWTVLIFQLFVSTVIIAAFIVKNAPPNALGSVNGLAQVASSGTRGIAPVFSSSLFSISLESRIAGGHLVEIVLMGITLVGIYYISRLPR
ncbi:MFS general substrate transporter [Gymnopus androsaceus JB14]|uniref:MFS general substrate transporter n=1 Tax=Gymnopus androsaceus JB14 TaxID=1447944 RepID=A0A6A4HQM2_9AGAR|nr:MFS general substrate transporter [Gymnopus androsaceus JB14]